MKYADNTQGLLQLVCLSFHKLDLNVSCSKAVVDQDNVNVWEKADIIPPDSVFPSCACQTSCFLEKGCLCGP